ncbi:MAG: pentapeptide repeat-containing protein [Nannocystaceae bacterium]
MSDKDTPPGSPEPPRPAEAKLLRRGALLRLFLWITEPTLIKGMALGVVLSLVITVGSKLDAVWYVASGLLLIAVAMIFGVIIGHYVFESRKKRLQKNALGLLADASTVLPAATEDLLALAQTRDAHHLHALWARLNRIKPTLRELSGLLVAMIFRVMAMSTLIAVLGGAISFAVFLATYLQVERMGEQNELLKSQNAMVQKEIDLVEAQMRADREAREVDLSLSTAAQRQAVVLGLIDAIDDDIALLKADDVNRGEGLGYVRPGSSKKITISTGMYRRIQRTLSQLDPYRVVDPASMTVGEVPRSPEQELLIHYLESSTIDLTRLSLRQAYFVGADLSELEIGEIDLNDSRFDGAVMTRIDLSDAYLEQASLRRIEAASSSFSGAHMAKANLGGAMLSGADLSGADLSGADLSLATLRQATLENADLSGASLAGAVLEQADMSGRLKLSGTDLAGADLREIDKAPRESAIKGAKGWELAAYSDALAKELGLDDARHAANKRAVDALREADSPEAAAKILADLRGPAPAAK